MIIEKKELSPNDVACVRLITGEELVGKVVELTATNLVVTRPVLLQIQMINQQQAGLGFAPFMVAVAEDAKYTIPVDKMLVAPMKARQDVASNYLKATTGLEIPTASKVII